LYTINSTQIGLGSNTDLCDARLVTNHLSHEPSNLINETNRVGLIPYITLQSSSSHSDYWNVDGESHALNFDINKHFGLETNATAGRK
jgi:hypothetical protein